MAAENTMCERNNTSFFLHNKKATGKMNHAHTCNRVLSFQTNKQNSPNVDNFFFKFSIGVTG